jgi:HAD superfamily hydrolase (TIGR01459 family)
MQPIGSLCEIIDGYDALLLDLWGVVHDGDHLYSGVAETLAELAARHIPVVFLSNAPRRAEKVQAVLDRLGVQRAWYRAIITSGDVGCRWLESGAAPWGPRYFYVGPEKDLDVLSAQRFEKVEALGQADFVLNVGFGEDKHPVSDMLPLLREAHRHNLPMLCLNPDLEVVKHSGERHPCAGAIAVEYAKLGGAVTWFGKPYAAVYEQCMAHLPGVEKARMLAVGDSLDTDIPGAQGFGIDSLLVTGGILHAMGLAAVAEECAARGLSPRYVSRGFIWQPVTRAAAQ